MQPPPSTEPARPVSTLNRTAFVWCFLSVLGAIATAPVAIELATALFSWGAFLVLALGELFWALGALGGVILGVVGIVRLPSRTGSIIAAVIGLLLLAGYAVYTVTGPSLFFS